MKHAAPDDTQNSTTVFEISIRSQRMIKVILLSILLLTILGCASAYAMYVAETRGLDVFAKVFMRNSEDNLPTLFTFGLLLFCSLMLLLISIEQGGTKWQLHWRVLMILFLLIAFDEAAAVHEKSIQVVRDTLDVSGWLFFAWVVPAWIFVIIFGLAYLRFLLALPKSSVGLFTLSGALYVGGALGIEMPGGAYAEVHGQDTFAFQMIATVEEVLEMAGLALFAYALVRFLGRRQEPLYLRVRAY